MPAVARVGLDKTGNIISGSLAPTVFVDGVPIAVEGATVIPYGKKCKASPRLGPGSNTVFAEGKQVSRKGDQDICFTPILSGSNDVNAG